MCRGRSALFLVLFVINFAASGLSGGDKRPPEQLNFSAEDATVNKPVEIPDSVMAILKKDEMVKDVLENTQISTDRIPSGWFTASAIQLSEAGVADLIVDAEPPLSGTNVTTFWVFRSTPRGYELVLTAPAHDLQVRRTRWNGYREIELSAETAVEFTSVLFRFDGKQYTKYRVRSQRLP